MLLWQTSLLMLLLGLQSIIGLQPALANAFEPPPNQDAPRSTAGGGSRPASSACPWDETSGATAIALAPQTFVGLSTQSQPALWLHLPAPSLNGLELSLFDEQLNGIAQQKVESSNATGFYRIPFPETIQLNQGEAYYWSVALICHPQRRTEDWVIGGWIRYQALPSNEADISISNGLPSPSPGSTHEGERVPNIESDMGLEQVTAQVNYYLDNGYWYDALTTLLPLMQDPSSSSLLDSTWVTLLHQANLRPVDVNLHDSSP